MRSVRVVVHGEVAEADVEEFASAATGRVPVHEADVHAAVVVGGCAVVRTSSSHFSMAGIERPDRTALAIREADGVAAEGGFGRGLAGVGTVVAGVVLDIAQHEVAPIILAEGKTGELVLHVGTDDADGVASVVVAVIMGRAEIGLLVQTAFVDDQHVVGFLPIALIRFPISNPVMIVVIAIHGIGEDNLLEVGEAGDGLRFGAGFGEGGQQHGGENRDDRDDDEEFNQREVLLFHVSDSFVS